MIPSNMILYGGEGEEPFNKNGFLGMIDSMYLMIIQTLGIPAPHILWDRNNMNKDPIYGSRINLLE